jgi:hypothetical protein
VSGWNNVTKAEQEADFRWAVFDIGDDKLKGLEHSESQSAKLK